MDESASIRNVLLQYGHAFVMQMSYTAIANGRSKLEERLARWLLMTHDRLDGDTLPMTHEFLSLMLSVHRPGVTLALHLLEKDGSSGQTAERLWLPAAKDSNRFQMAPMASPKQSLSDYLAVLS